MAAAPLHSIRSRMLFGFLFLTTLLLLVAAASVYMLDRTRRITDIHVAINQLQIHTLTLIKTDNDFFDIGTEEESYFEHRKSSFLQRRDSLVALINANFRQVQAITRQQAYPVDNLLTNIDTLFDHYNRDFAALEVLLFKRGFRDYGLEGVMRQHAHALEHPAMGVPLATVLSMRRNEKDFFLRHDPHYIDDFNWLAEQTLRDLARQARVNTAGVQEVRAYQARFNELADIYQTIGLNSRSGLRAQLNRLTDRLAAQYGALAETSAALATRAILQTRLFYLLAVLGALLFTLLSSFWIAKRLSAPIAQLSQSIHEALQHPTPQRVKLHLTRAASEIVELVDAFNQLMDRTSLQLNEINAKTKLLKKKNRVLKKLNHELDSFLYSTAHDLRSPLSSLEGLLRLAGYENQQPALHTYFEMMKASIKRQETFIQQIVNYSKNSKLELQIEPIALAPFIDDIIEAHRYMEGALHLTTHVDIRQDSPFYSDKNRLSILFNNLISNAIRYSDSRKESAWIRIQARVTETELSLEFADNGIGIEPDHLHRIFDMFYRASITSKGSGLGLFIFRETLSRLRGFVHVESQPQMGTKFFLRVPNEYTKAGTQLTLPTELPAPIQASSKQA